MTILFATRTLVPLALLVLLASCDRPKGPPPPKAAEAIAAGTAEPSPVALSGTILDPQPNPATAKRTTPAKGSAASAAAGRVAQEGPDRQALRDFQAEQERRDRELLDQDLSEAQLRARDNAGESDGANVALDESEAAGDWSSSDQLPPDDEPPYYDEPELDDGYDPRDSAYRP